MKSPASLRSDRVATFPGLGGRFHRNTHGEQIIDIDLDDWTEPHQNPDGTQNKFSTALKDYPRVGPVGLQGIHGKGGQPVWFRNLKIRVLD